MLTSSLGRARRALRLLAILTTGATALPGALAATVPPKLTGVQWQQPAKPIVDFALLNQDARATRFSTLRGKTVLVFFGFANCPDICPTTMHELHLATVSSDVDRKRTQVLMISVDGRRDTPAVLRAFLATQSNRFMAMTGEPSKVARIAAQFPAMFVTPPEADSVQRYNVAHTESVYLVDEQGLLRAVMSRASVTDMSRATAFVQQHPVAAK